MNVDYLIVGGGLSAIYAAQSVREHDGKGDVLLVTEERHLPYDRVPLSKAYMMGRVKQESLFPRKRDFLDRQNIRVVQGTRVRSLDPGANSALLQGGEQVQYRKLMLATGGRPRKLDISGSDLRGIHYLRTLDDCDAIRSETQTARKAVVLGGGFIGCELAAAFVAKGIDTTVVEAAPTILSLAFDESTAKWIEGHLVEKGVKVITGSKGAEFVGDGGRVTGVRTNQGATISGDLIVVGVGIIPNAELAEESGLRVDRGIVVDEFLQTSDPNVYAAGDVARFYHPVFGHYLRVEHYDIAVRHGKVAGANMAGGRHPFSEMPYFFSYLFDLTTKAYGDMSVRDAVIRRGELGTKGFFQFFFAAGRLQAFLSMNRSPDEIQVARGILARRPSLEELDGISDESRDLKSFAG